MKNNQNIDFFSSPHTRLIPFSEIKHPYHDKDDYENEKNIIRKSSFNQIYQPIKPFNINLFNDKIIQNYQQSISQSENYYLFNQLNIKQSKNVQNSQINIQNSQINQQNSQMNQQNSQINQQNSQINQQDSQINQQDSQINQQDSQINQQDSQQLKQRQQQIHNECDSFQQDLFATPKKKNIKNFKIFEHTTIQKQRLFCRSNQKGLRKLSNLAYSIVNNSNATTYKQVAEKLLGKLNFQISDLNDQQLKIQKSSMQNIKRRVYDSLNVLIALGVIKRTGNKITKQKQTKLTSLALNNSTFQENQKYQQMIENYQRHLVNLQTKKRTQQQLKQKLQIFRKLIQRNKKHKIISKNHKFVRFPFLAFINKNINHTNQSNVKKIHTQNIELNYEMIPQSYGDLDFIQLLKNVQSFQIQKQPQTLF